MCQVLFLDTEDRLIKQIKMIPFLTLYSGRRTHKIHTYIHKQISKTMIITIIIITIHS